jgi:hypothetical protein
MAGGNGIVLEVQNLKMTFGVVQVNHANCPSTYRKGLKSRE